MMSALLVAGILSVLSGLGAIVYGIPVKEFSFGNTMIIVGATAICTGMLMIGLWVVVGELRNIARRLAPRALAESRGRPVLAPPAGAPPRLAPAEGGFLFSRDESPMQDEDDVEMAAPPMSPHPSQDDLARWERSRPGPASMPEPAVEPAPPPRSGRDRLFSTPRKERDRAPPRAAEPAVSELRAAEATEAGSAGFDSAWPKAERSRAGEAASQRRSGRSPSTNDSTNDDRSGASIIKSGVVDGMAYSLYSDGSIEAQMPEGMMRFGSIDELRAHLDQR